MLLGIDGCRAGWVCVSLEPGTGDIRAVILPHLEELSRFVPAPEVIAIDIPMGLPDSGARTCETEARKLLGRPRSSSVFPTPIRPMLRAGSYAEACTIGRQVDGRKLSRQTWGILPKIREADAFLRAHVPYQRRVWEVHPELSFRAWGLTQPAAHGKKTPEGHAEREKLVAAHFGPGVQSARNALLPGGWASDDFLDAFAALWTAQRIAGGRAVTIPSDPPTDAFGLRMAITY